MIYLSPRNGWFVAALTEDAGGRVDLAEELPPLWEGKYQGHFIPLEKVGATPQNDISHIALLESLTHGEADPFYFGEDAITHNGVMLWFSEKRQKYYHFHCRACALKAVEWLTENQEEWSKSAIKIAGRA